MTKALTCSRGLVDYGSEGWGFESLRARTVEAPYPSRVFRTLSYIDGMNFAARASAVPALFGVALMDPICPPSTLYAAARPTSRRST